MSLNAERAIQGQQLYKKPLPTKDIPSYLVRDRIRVCDYAINKIVGRGLRLNLNDKTEEEAHLVFNTIKNTRVVERNSPLVLMTKYGAIRLYNYCRFLRTLSGMLIDEDMILDDELLNFMLGRMPRPVVDLFGWCAPLEEVKTDAENSISLSVRFTLGELSVAALMEADLRVWSELLKQAVLVPVAEEGPPTRMSLPLISSCVAGSFVLTPRKYKSLNVGDVIVLENSMFDVNGSGKVSIGDQTVAVAIAEGSSPSQQQFTVKSKPKKTRSENGDVIKGEKKPDAKSEQRSEKQAQSSEKEVKSKDKQTKARSSRTKTKARSG